MNNTGFELLFCLLLFGAAIWLIDRVRNTERAPPQGMTPGTAATGRKRGGTNRVCPTCGYDGNAPAASTCSAYQASLVEPAPSGSEDEPLPEQRHVQWLLDELRSESIWADLSDDQRMRIRAHYAAQLTQDGRSVAPSRPIATEAPPATPTTQPLVVHRPARDPFMPVVAADPPPPPREPRARPWESWDPAVTLLYLGAFLVVSSGLFYASFNWSAFSNAARIVLLGGATLAFLAGGLALLPFQRVRPAAVTFVGIGALLVPMNVLAAWNILSDAASRPALTLALGTATTGILYAVLSYRPAGIVYRYGTVVAGAITAFSLPPALGTDWRWGAILVTLLSAAALDSPRLLRGRRRRFATPATHAGIAAAIIGPLAVLGLTGDITETSFTHAALFAALAIVLWRFAQRRESPALAIVTASAVIAGLAWLVRTPANGFRDALGLQIAAVSGGVGSIALFAMLIAAWWYVIAESAVSAQLSDGGRPWWTYLATFTVGAGLSIAFGWFSQRREVATVATAFAYQVSGIGSLTGIVAWLMSIGAVAVYIVDRTRPYTFAHSADSLWWLRYEAMLLVTIAGCWVAGRRRLLDLLAIPLTMSCALAIVLALRMLTVDLTVWMWAGVFVGVALWARWLRAWIPADHTFDRAVARMFDGLGVVTIAATIGLNTWLVWTDDTDAWSGVIVWMTIAAAIAATALVRSWARLVYAAIAGGWIALGFMVDALDLALADGGILFAGYAWLLALTGVTIARRSAARVYAEIFEHGAIAVALSPIALALTVPDAWEPGTAVYTRLTLAVLSLAGIVTLGAVVRRNAIRGIAASAIAMAGVMMQITAQEPTNIQAFTTPLGLYALVLGWFRRRHGPTFDGLTIAAAVLLIGPPLLDSFGHGGFVWWLVAGGIALGFVAYGIVLAHRTPLAAGIVGITILVGRQLFDAVNALPTWIVLGLAGIALLTIGTVWLGFREALTNAFGRFRVTWGRLR